MQTNIPYFSYRYRLRNGWVQGYSDWVSRPVAVLQATFRDYATTYARTQAQCWRFIIPFTRTRPVSLRWARWNQSELSLPISV